MASRLRRVGIGLVVGVATLLHAGAARAQRTSPVTWLSRPATAGDGRVRAAWFDQAPVIDGRLDESVWATAAKLSGFVQTDPGDNLPTTFPTEVSVGYDAGHLYFAVTAVDNPAHVRATIARRDDILSDDNVRIYLDTYREQRQAYVLAFNPLGVQQDGVWAQGAEPDYSLDLPMRSRGLVNDSGWCVEVAIPFASLRFPKNGGAWAIQVVRQIQRGAGETHSWRPLERGRTSFLAQAGLLEGLDRIAWSRPFELIPSAVAVRGDAARTNVGLTAKLGLSPDATIHATLRPDFAQVEADAQVVTANQRFPILREEKRPFFLEGLELLQTPLRVVHTRAIVSPDAAAKVSWKRSGHAFSVLLASDRGDATGGSVRDLNTQAAVLRWQQVVHRGSAVGMATTFQRLGHRVNAVAGADGHLELGSHSTLDFQFVGTEVRTAEEGGGVHGFAYHLAYRRTDRHWTWGLVGEGWSPDYVARLGFTTQTDVASFRADVRYDADPRLHGSVVTWSLLNTTLAQVDWDGRPKYAYLFPGVSLRLAGNTRLDVRGYVDYLYLSEDEFGPSRSATDEGAFLGPPGRETTYRGLFIGVEAAPSEQLSVSASLDRAWDVFDYDFGALPRYARVSPEALMDPEAPLDPGPARALDVRASLAWQPSDVMRLEVTYDLSRLVRNDTGRLAYREDLATVRWTFRPTPFFALRMRGDVSSLKERVSGETLLAWTPTPGTALYVGWGQDLERGAPDAVSRRNPWVPVRRTLFTKVSYALRSR